MDIRSFFGGKSSNTNRGDESKVNPPRKISRIITDDEDCETNEENIKENEKSILRINVETTIDPNGKHIDDNPKGKHANDNHKSSQNRNVPKSVQEIITWAPGEKVPYMALVNSFERIEKISSRLEKENQFCNLFRAIITTTPEDLDPITYLVSNKVFPAYEGLELGIGDALLIKAVVESTGRNKAAVQADYDKEGDLGIVASQSRSSQSTLGFAVKAKPLTAVEVLEQLRTITRTTGDKAMDRKVSIIKKMLVRCQKNEAKYLIRALQGKLRIGTASQTVLVSLAQAFALSPPAAVRAKMEGDDGYINVTTPDEDETEENIISEIEEKENKNIKNKNNNDNDNEQEDKNNEDKYKTEEGIEPEEAKKLRKGRSLGKGARLECAVIAVKRAFSECPSLSSLTSSLLVYPLYELHQACRLRPGIPVAPMLAKPTKKLEEVLQRLSGQEFTMEYKYDGERAQLHILEDGTTKIFSRNSEDNSNKYPDLIDVIKRARKEGVSSCVIDAEVVAYDREKGCLLPFQVLSTRKRKVDEGEENNQKVKVVLQAFDLLLLNGKSLLRESLKTRRDLLLQSFQEEEGYFHFAKGQDCKEDGDTAPIEMFMQEACAAQCEGLMVKTLTHRATYEPSKRSTNWLKLKKDYIEGMGVCDSVDLVPLGAYRGRGKRAQTYGAYLMACYDPDSDEYQSVCKVGTGFKDEDLARLYELMQTKIIPNHRRPANYSVDSALEPDDWFEPSVVWECAAADLSRSSVHKGGIGRLEGSQDRGIGLRFPRFLRERPDKGPENATSSEQIVDMFFSQGGDLQDKVDEDDEDDELL